MKRKKIKPIETYYNGYRFRSRLEARWAVFFDALDIPYEYEPEGYQLPSGWYLPDFWLSDHKTNKSERGCFVEIKPYGDIDNETRNKAAELSYSLGNDVFVILGSPDAKMNPENEVSYYIICFGKWKHNSYDKSSGVPLEFIVEQENIYIGTDKKYWMRCPDCETNGMIWEGVNEHLSCGGCNNGHSCVNTFDDKILIEAMNRARKVRFEHGESP